MTRVAKKKSVRRKAKAPVRPEPAVLAAGPPAPLGESRQAFEPYPGPARPWEALVVGIALIAIPLQGMVQRDPFFGLILIGSGVLLVGMTLGRS